MKTGLAGYSRDRRLRTAGDRALRRKGFRADPPDRVVLRAGRRSDQGLHPLLFHTHPLQLGDDEGSRGSSPRSSG
jgi:hypothetical protein